MTSVVENGMDFQRGGKVDAPKCSWASWQREPRNPPRFAAKLRRWSLRCQSPKEQLLGVRGEGTWLVSFERIFLDLKNAVDDCLRAWPRM